VGTWEEVRDYFHVSCASSERVARVPFVRTQSLFWPQRPLQVEEPLQGQLPLKFPSDFPSGPGALSVGYLHSRISGLRSPSCSDPTYTYRLGGSGLLNRSRMFNLTVPSARQLGQV
jgi:hypothetical protein